jgi:hypothetical protein
MSYRLTLCSTLAAVTELVPSIWAFHTKHQTPPYMLESSFVLNFQPWQIVYLEEGMR